MKISKVTNEWCVEHPAYLLDQSGRGALVVGVLTGLDGFNALQLADESIVLIGPHNADVELWEAEEL